MRGWERVGVVGDNRFILFDLHMLPVIGGGDILAFQDPCGNLRYGQMRARHAMNQWLGYNCGVPALAASDIVYRATALGEHAFKPRASAHDE